MARRESSVQNVSVKDGPGSILCKLYPERDVSWQDCKRMHPSAVVSTMRLSVCSVDGVQEK